MKNVIKPTAAPRPAATAVRALSYFGAAAVFLGSTFSAQATDVVKPSVKPPKANVLQATKRATAAADSFSGNGWWYNASQPGTGFMFEAQGDTGFVAFFMYTDTGAAIWYAASGTFTQTASGYSFSGMMQSYRGGQPVGSSTPASPTATNVGNVTMTFGSSGATVNFPGGRVMNATRFNFNGIDKPATGTQSEVGWYWNSGQAGRGYAIEVQNNLMFMAMFHYNADGSPTWNTVTTAVGANGSFTNADFVPFTGGQSLTSAYRAATQGASLGKMTANFSDPCTGSLTLPGGGSVAINRFAFGVSQQAACRSKNTPPPPPPPPAGGYECAPKIPVAGNKLTYRTTQTGSSTVGVVTYEWTSATYNGQPALKLTVTSNGTTSIAGYYNPTTGAYLGTDAPQSNPNTTVTTYDPPDYEQRLINTILNPGQSTTLTVTATVTGSALAGFASLGGAERMTYRQQITVTRRPNESVAVPAGTFANSCKLDFQVRNTNFQIVGPAASNPLLSTVLPLVSAAFESPIDLSLWLNTNVPYYVKNTTTVSGVGGGTSTTDLTEFKQ